VNIQAPQKRVGHAWVRLPVAGLGIARVATATNGNDARAIEDERTQERNGQKDTSHQQDCHDVASSGWFGLKQLTITGVTGNFVECNVVWQEFTTG
jgi:hypothetical protein